MRTNVKLSRIGLNHDLVKIVRDIYLKIDMAVTFDLNACTDRV